MDLSKVFNSGGLTLDSTGSGTGVVGQTVSSPYYNPGSVINSNTGQAYNSAPGPTLPSVGTNPLPSSSQQSSNSGSNNNSGLDPHINPSSGVWDDNYYAQNHQASQDDINRLINDTYNSSNDYLNQAESALRSDYANVPGQIQGNYDVNAQTLKNQTDQANAGLNAQSDQNSYANENALAAGRRLYSELQQGAQQRFGGATSAGQASSEILGTEQQRQAGQTQRTYANLAQQVSQAHMKVNQDYDAQINKLTVDKQTALQQANSDFQSKLLTLANDRTQAVSAKNQAQLQALQDLRTKVFQINLQNLQFEQTLAAQRNQASAYIGNNSTSLAQYAASTQDAFNQALHSVGFNPTSNFQIGGQSNQQQQYTGAVGTPNYQKYPNDGFTY